MPFPFALSRLILLSIIAITNITWSVLSAIALHEKTGGGMVHGQDNWERVRNDIRLVFQVLAICFGIFSLFTIIGCLCHQCASQDEEAGNTRNVGLFGFCWLLSFALAISLTVHARQDGGQGLCNDFANAGNPTVPAGVQLGMAYISPVLALIGFIISWMDKFPGAVKVTPRYPITKAPSSHFAAYAHDLDGNYTYPPAKSRSRNNSKWSDVPLHC